MPMLTRAERRVNRCQHIGMIRRADATRATRSSLRAASHIAATLDKRNRARMRVTRCDVIETDSTSQLVSQR
jgi:hypothetical protein